MVFTLTRDDASRMLGVSTRTIDRYIHSGRIRSKREGKLIMLHEEDVSQVKNGGAQTDYEIIAPKPTTAPAISYDARESHNEILRAIETIIREKDSLIQELSFKIGRMESDLVNSVSKLEHKKTLLALEESSHNRIHDMDMLARARDELEKKFQKERFISTCLLIGVFTLLVACAFLMFHFFSLRETIIQNI